MINTKLFETREEWELYLLLEAGQKIMNERLAKQDFKGALNLYFEPIVFTVPEEARRFFCT